MIKRLLVRALERISGSRVVLMTPTQAQRWEQYQVHFCEVRYSDKRWPAPGSKMAKVGDIGRQTRAAVIQRSGGLCELKSSRCTRLAGDIHHLTYKSFGGTNELENLAHACIACHQGIHSADNPPRRAGPKVKESLSDALAREIRWR